jgi:hypothetical protein
MAEGTGIMQKHVGDKLDQVKVFRRRVVERKQAEEVYVVPLENQTRYPAQYINDYQVFCNHRDRTEETRSVSIHHITLFNRRKGIHILLFTEQAKIKTWETDKKSLFFFAGY